MFYWFYQTDFALHKADTSPSASATTSLSVTAPVMAPEQLQLQVRRQAEVETPVLASPEVDKPAPSLAQPLAVNSRLQSAQLPAKNETSQPAVNRVNEALPLTGRAATSEHSEQSATPTNSNDAMPGALTLKASEPSWVEIKDSTRKKLFYQLLNAGEEINLQGKPPYSVFLGNAHKVRIEMNQQNIVFDHLMSGQRKTLSLSIKADAQVKLNTRR
ncbi:hypothetical protein MNBD_GAMMA10-789 [hydrothermal vent metagenome]|uniref:Cytoskeleton protein RodZ-like C-terminal domain-containing protein n=1 Tax=hydrothermal vent metagenome TaxID=652676 RepID=A0A3B0XWR0_9ZZZZ